MNYRIEDSNAVLSSVSEVVNALDGTTAFGELLGVGPSAVSNYRAAEKFPDEKHMKIYLAVRQRGLAMNPSLLGSTPAFFDLLFPNQKTATQTKSLEAAQ